MKWYELTREEFWTYAPRYARIARNAAELGGCALFGLGGYVFMVALAALC